MELAGACNCPNHEGGTYCNIALGGIPAGKVFVVEYVMAHGFAGLKVPFAYSLNSFADCGRSVKLNLSGTVVAFVSMQSDPPSVYTTTGRLSLYGYLVDEQ
jgi:hypothetical protein